MKLQHTSRVLFAVACVTISACHAEPATSPTARAATGTADTTLQIKPAATMPTPRAAHSATLLADGRVLLAGGCAADGCEEGIAGDAILFNPATTSFSSTGHLLQPRVGHRAVPLADGSVLLFGGYTRDGVTNTVERYVPATGRFEKQGHMLQARDGFSATLLSDGSILLAGGYADGMQRLASAERYDPATGTSRNAGAMSVERMSHTATALPDGRVLIAGGSRSSRDVLASLEVFDPATDTFSPAGTLARARHKHAAIVVGDRVLIIGGAALPESHGHFNDSEWWTPRGIAAGPRMTTGRYKFLDSLARLRDGRVLVAGGGMRAEVLDADGSAFHPIDDAIGRRLAFASATTLADGRILIAGGYDPDIRVNPDAWLAAGDTRDTPSNTSNTD